MEKSIGTIESYKHRNVRLVAYLSAEYLLGPHLLNDLLNLGLTQECDKALRKPGLGLTAVATQEP
jgi:starch phosphorylase